MLTNRNETENVVWRNDAMMMRKAKRNASTSLLKPMNKSDFREPNRNRSEFEWAKSEWKEYALFFISAPRESVDRATGSGMYVNLNTYISAVVWILEHRYWVHIRTHTHTSCTRVARKRQVIGRSWLVGVCVCVLIWCLASVIYSVLCKLNS